QAGGVVEGSYLGLVGGVVPLVDVLLGEIEPDRQVPLGACAPGGGVDLAGGDVGRRELVKGLGASLGEGDVDHPTDAVLIEGCIRTLDVVPGQARQRRLVAGVRAAGGLIVLHPFRVDELRDSADGLLRLVGGDTGQVDGDA